MAIVIQKMRASFLQGIHRFTLIATAAAMLLHSPSGFAQIPSGPSGSSFELTPSPASITALLGGTEADATIKVSSLNGFQGSVSVAITGVPAGVTAALSSPTVRVGSSVTIAATASSKAVPGTYPLTITGSSGTAKGAATVQLVIPPPGFSLSPAVSSFTLLAGGIGSSTNINVVDQGGFNGEVSFSLSGVPAGVSASFKWASSAYYTVLTFVPGARPVPGTYSVLVTGVSGKVTSTTTIALNIPAPSFGISCSPASLTALQGGAGVSSTIGIVNPVGLSNPDVSLAVSGLPAGTTAAWNWPVVNATSPVRLTVTAGSSAVPGTYQLAISGTSGSTKSTAMVQLIIPKPSFNLSASASAISLMVGQDGWNLPINIGILNQAGLANPVTLSVSGVPANVTSAFTSVNSTTQGLTFKVGSAALPGTYTVTVEGTSGSATSSATIALTIPSPSFTLSPSVAPITLQPGGSGVRSTISVVDQSGFAGSVAFAVSGVPAGVSASWSEASSALKSALTLTPGSTVAPGTYIVVVTGTSGNLTGSATIAVTVPAPSFTLSASPSALTLSTSASGAVGGAGATGGAGAAGAASTISVAGLAASSPSVVLSVTGLPAGVTAAFASAVTNSQNRVTFTASNAALPGIYTVTVQGTSAGTTETTPITLTIPAPSFSISSSASSLNVPASGRVGATISVSGLSNPASGVSLTADGVPAGVTASFSPSITNTTSALTFTGGSAAVAGTYAVSVTGTSGTVSSTVSITLTVQAAEVGNPTSVAITQPTFGFNVLPGSVRRIFATVTGGITNGVTWAVTGGASLSSTTGHWVDVTAPATGSSCSINGAENYSVSSATQLTLTATSQENPSKTAQITINVCNPAVQVQVVPFYTTLYAEQKADIQAFVWGSVNRDVTWAITAQPNGGDGSLMDSVNQDTVFSATVAGRYTLTATSVADGSKANTATIYVTGHSMPYDVTPSETMPIDCSVDPALTGTTYNVGPSQEYKTIQSVPWTTLTAGSTVRIFNEDTTGASPTTYHEYFQVATHASRTQPVRVCGVSDSRGNLPVIDASNSTGSSTVNSYSAGYGAVGIGAPGWAGVYTGSWTGPQDLIVEGLKIQNAKPSYSFTPPAGGAAKAWVSDSACVRLFRSMDTVVRGVDGFNCGNGFFSDFNANEGFAAVANTLYEGNHLHSNGVAGSYIDHQLYLQGWNEVAQFNVIDEYEAGAEGSDLKGRGFPEIVRYNHFGDGASRQIDMVDNQDAGPYTMFEGYLGGGSKSYRAIYTADQYTADLLAAAVEAHHADYAYGNTFVNSSSGVPIHYSTDHGSLENDRIGTLWFYSNSFYEPACKGCPNYRWQMFDTSGGGGNDFAEIEWPQIQALNNAIWMDAPAEPYFYWNRESNQFTTFGNNVININWGTNKMTGGDGTGWATAISAYAYQGAGNSAGNAGVSNLSGVSVAPFNETTFQPNAALENAGTSMPAFAPKLPVRFQYGPSAVQTVRVQPMTVGAME